MDDTTQPTVTTDLPTFGMVPNWLWQHPDCTPIAVMVWLALWTFVSYGKFTSTGHAVAWPSHSTLATMLRMHERTVIRHVQVLESIGALTIEGRTDDKGGDTSNRYHLHFTTPKGGGGDSPVTGVGDTSVTGGSDSSVTQSISNMNEIQFELDPSFAPTASTRQRDPIWDMLVELCGEPEPDQTGNYGKTVSWLKQKGATPEEMIVRAGLLVEEYEGSRYLTAASLRKYWTRYDSMVGRMNTAEFASRLEGRRSEHSDALLLERIAQKAADDPVFETKALEGP